MRVPALGLLFLLAGFPVSAAAAEASPAEPSPAEVVERSIAFHDPHGVWAGDGFRMEIEVAYAPAFAERHGREDRAQVLVLAPGRQRFEITDRRGDDTVVHRLEGGVSTVLLNGSAEITEADRERVPLYDPLALRDYYEYMLLMPMKLADPGTRLGESVARVDYHGREALEIRVTYEPEVGSDIWYYYFDPTTYALVGCKFHKDEAENDGEYLVYEEQVEDEERGVRLPRSRAWFFNVDGEPLATDTILTLGTP